ncbi:hypothetical protein MKW92_033017, partial [Papaver armeniacum]
LDHNMANEDKADGNLAKRAKQFRPPLSFEILYGEDNWISWVQQPFDLPALIERRAEKRHMNWIHDSGLLSVTVMVYPFLHILNVLRILNVLLMRLSQFQNCI